MNCKMCYIRMSREDQQRAGRERSAKEWIELGRICRDEGLLFLLLTGGEPFLRHDFQEIYDGLYKLGIQISINTNGTLITPEMVEWLKERPPVKVNVTLYGGSPEAYDRLCGYAQGYERAVRTILMLKEAGILVCVNTSYTLENTAELEKIAAFVKEHELHTRVTSYMFPPTRKKENEPEITAKRLSPEIAGEVLWRSAHYRYGEERWKERRRQLLAGIPDEDGDCPIDEKMQCMAGRSTFWMTWDWQMRACGMMTAPTYRIESSRFTEVWEKLGEAMDELTLPKECSVCRNRPACVICGASAQAEGQGDMTKRPEYICRMIGEYVRLIRQELAEEQAEAPAGDEKENLPGNVAEAKNVTE